LFKLISALLDTIPFYFGVRFFSKYLQINPMEGYEKGEKKLPSR
jgi:hypothetical protein